MTDDTPIGCELVQIERLSDYHYLEIAPFLTRRLLVTLEATSRVRKCWQIAYIHFLTHKTSERNCAYKPKTPQTW